MNNRNIAILTLALCAGSAAQDYRGAVLGRVTDPSGAAVAGAKVAAVNEATNTVAAAQTAADGAYFIPFLIPGRYRVEVEASGFQKYAQSGITVSVNSQVRVDVTLQVGAITESVTVTADAPLLETATATMGQVVDRRKVEAMPLNGRMIFMLNRLAQGVIWQTPTFGATGTSGLRPFDNLGGSAWSMNGGRLTSNEFLLDGAPNSTRGRYNFAPPVDAVEEFKIQTNSFDAQYGRTGGGVVNMTLKSGTNDLHGQMWNFTKYGMWNANNSLNVATGRPKPPQQYNQYGAMGSGPVYLPGLYNGRNRTFWMFTWEGLRERVPFPITTSVPTAAERAGDFSVAYRDGGPFDIYDPLTTRTDSSGRLVRDPFPARKIPAARIHPIAVKVLDIYPLPNVPDQRQNNFVNPVNKGIYNYNAEVVRIDHVLSERHKVFGSFFRNHRDEFRSNNGLQGTFANQGQWPQTRNNHGFIADLVSTLSATSVFNARVGFTRFLETNFLTDVRKFDASTLGFVRLPGPYLPVFSLDQYTTIGVGNQGVNTADNTASIQANYTRTYSRHTLKYGGEYRNIRSNPVTTGTENGEFTFNRAFTRRDVNTQDATSGHSVASLLLGYPASAQIGAGQARAQQWHYLALFIQDDLRVTSRLTVNLGLRWDYESPVTERYDRLVRGFAFDQPSPLAEQVRNAAGVANCPACANLKGGLRFAGVNGAPRGLFDPDRNNFQPRLGAAYRLTGKTVLRGGFGMYYSPTTQFGPQTGFFVPTNYIANDLQGRAGVPELGVNTFANPFPAGRTPAPGASLGLMTQVGQSVSFDDPKRVVPFIYQFTFGIQQQVTPNLVVEAAFVGSRTRKLPVGKSFNFVPREELAKGVSYLQQVVDNPFAGLLPGSAFNGRTVQRQQLLLPFPQFSGTRGDNSPTGGSVQNSMSLGESSFHSFQLRVEKRLSGGVTFISSYTLSKNIERNNFLNAQDTALVRQLTDYDRTHVWVFSGVAELPFGRGKRLGSNVPGWANHLIGGWQYVWIANVGSGRPQDAPGGVEPLGSPAVSNQSLDLWFNNCYVDTSGRPSAQCAANNLQPAWRVRPAGELRTTPNRFSNIRVPVKPIFDMSLHKLIRFNERTYLEYRFETFNTFNSVIFAPPNTDFSNANFGKVPQPRAPIYFPRNLQMGLKLYF
jgi:hypothetical protein